MNDYADVGVAAKPLLPAARFFRCASARRLRCSLFNRFLNDRSAASPSVLLWLGSFAAIFFFNFTSSGSAARFLAIDPCLPFDHSHVVGC
jgi:hypothetical protein